MNKEMIVSSNGHETMVAILEDDLVAEIFVERERHRGVVGNVYKGRVSKVLPGMQSSFIDLGLERDGFLYVADVIDTLVEFDKLAGDDDDEPKAEGSKARESRAERENRPQQKIEDLLKEGQEIVVQVVKEPLGTKGARLTSHVTMPGRFLVFMPTVDHIGVSRKIESRDERQRLRGIVREFREAARFHRRRHHPDRRGRTAERRHPRRPRRVPQDLDRDAPAQRIVAGARGVVPGAEHRQPPAARSADRGLSGDPHRQLPGVSSRSRSSSQRIMPTLAPKVKHYAKPFPIFDEYGVQAEIDKALKSKVFLKSGGSIVINQTEALVAIDVNTGRFVGKKTSGRLEDTIVKTNLEAVKEIVRQIRLRDLGGIIVLDLIDMEDKKNRQKVYAGGRAGAQEGSLAVEGAAGVRLRPGHRHPQAREAEPGARADRTVPVLLGHRRDQVELDDLLRDPERGEEGQSGYQRPPPAAAGESGHRAGAEGRGERRAEGLTAGGWKGRHHQG